MQLLDDDTDAGRHGATLWQHCSSESGSLLAILSVFGLHATPWAFLLIQADEKTCVPFGSCPTVEHFVSTALRRFNASLSAADYVLIPLDDGRLPGGNNTMIIDGLVELVSQAQAMISPSAPKRPRIIMTQGYDGKANHPHEAHWHAFPQLLCFKHVSILSPLGGLRHCYSTSHMQ